MGASSLVKLAPAILVQSLDRLSGRMVVQVGLCGKEVGAVHHIRRITVINNGRMIVDLTLLLP